MCNIVSNHLAINNLALAATNNKNESALDEARKALYKAIIYMESVVTAKIDAPFNEYEKNLAELESVNEERRYSLVRKMGLSIELLKAGYGDNTKWRSSFVDLEGRFATTVKNLLNLKTAMENMQPGADDYAFTSAHFKLIIKLLKQSADSFSERFQISTKREDDVLMTVRFLTALKYICTLFNTQENVALIEKKIEYWGGVLKTLKKAQSATAATN
jgi:DNA-binding transcriptional MocR family regulator